jgi:hypothetical protein
MRGTNKSSYERHPWTYIAGTIDMPTSSLLGSIGATPLCAHTALLVKSTVHYLIRILVR